VNVGDYRFVKPSPPALKGPLARHETAIPTPRTLIPDGCNMGVLLRVIGAVESEQAKCEGDEATGVRILRNALEAPARQIAVNSGADPGVVVDRMRSGNGTLGFDAARGVYVDLIEAGIIDPAKVVRMSLENAVSVAGVLLLAEGTLTELEEEHTERATPDLG